MMVEADRQASPEARDDIDEALISRSPARLRNPCEERASRVEALQGALEIEMAVEIYPAVVNRLGLEILETRGVQANSNGLASCECRAADD